MPEYSQARLQRTFEREFAKKKDTYCNAHLSSAQKIPRGRLSFFKAKGSGRLTISEELVEEVWEIFCGEVPGA